MSWEALLRRATVALAAPSSGGAAEGTGFFVAPGVVATCAHVVAGPGETPAPVVHGRVVALDLDVELRSDPERCFRDPATGLDLALLRAHRDVAVAPVATSSAMRPHDVMWTFGHPAGAFRGGQHATFTYQGDSRRSRDEAFELPRVYGTPVGRGYSGSPVVDTRTGGVCGMLSTSDMAGSAHLIPISAILARCPEARYDGEGAAPYLDWLASLTDEQVTAGGWRFPGPRLAAYLAAAAARAEDHPYPGVLPGTPRPPLSQVYVRHHTQRLSDAAPPGEGTGAEPAVDGTIPSGPIPPRRERTPAEDVLVADHDVVVIGGPGAGKSSLLRTTLIDLATRWLARRETGERVGPSIGAPVRLLAADLTGPGALSTRIAAAVAADLGGLLRADLPAEVFAAPPLPGERWLVLVDGLDEVLDAERRAAVLAALRAQREGPYRFAVASRPLHGPELADLLTVAPGDTYELLPFDAGQLADLARGWLAGSPDPETAVRDFMLRVADIRPPALVRSPLLATMLCQLYMADPIRPLPRGRHGLYRAFLDLLAAHAHSGASGLIAQARSVLDQYGTDPGEVVRRVFDTLPRLARTRWTQEDGRPAATIVAQWVASSRPPAMRHAEWEDLVRAVLRRSGVLTERAGDLDFLHQTLMEFLSARAIAADPVASEERFRELFGRRGKRIPSPYAFDSHTLFLIGFWQADLAYMVRLEKALLNVASSWARLPPVWPFLRTAWRSYWEPRRRYQQSRLSKYVSQRDLDALSVIAEIVADGFVPLVPATVPMTTDGLARVLNVRDQSTDMEVKAARLLADLGDPRGREKITKVAANTGVFEPRRVEAALTLARQGDPQGSEILAEMAGDTDLWLSWRIQAAGALAELGDPSGVSRLMALFEASERGFHRIEAAFQLTEHGDPRGPRLLAELAADSAFDRDWSAYYLPVLVKLRLPRHREILETLATPSPGTYLPRDEQWQSVDAAELLATLDPARGMAKLAAIAGDERFSKIHRQRARAAAQRTHEGG
ncbi:hypothetical protein GCM10009530_35250 [Microbispora corallina]|uniref:NACHT domain-containing protein n=1 Tax=Microbispora corallina TaxID=83302 RepID=A0ABQ4FYQ5_9ACTN|nr:trypsin-like peptidase domain-containing protein [Microbispora corallina]GIH39939.1 hypothetical protein Mco01_29390 [Microbispora corallina]